MIQESLRYGFYASVVAGLLALSGVFASFEGRFVIANSVTLDTVTLALMLGGAGFLTGWRARGGGTSAIFINAVIGSVVVAAVLGLLVLIEATINLTFVFPNLINPMRDTLTFGLDLVPGLLTLLGVSVALGLVAAALVLLPGHARSTILLTLGITTVIGLLESQVRGIITLPDALALALAFTFGYGAALIAPASWVRAVVGAVVGGVVGVGLLLLVNGGGLAAGGVLRGTGSMPVILSVASLLLPVIFALAGLLGAVASSATRGVHNGAVQFIIGLLILGILNWQNGMTITATVFTVALLFAAFWLIAPVAAAAAKRHAALDRPERTGFQQAVGVIAVLILLAAPSFLGLYITDVLNLVGIYIVLGIGLNIVVGYAGLLNLGFVAFFAIGAYTIGLLTTPSLLTCGGVVPSQITAGTVGTVCTGVMSFWTALPFAVLLSAIGGMLLGIPVLRLRGDYFAIVTLGFGEIIRLLVRFDDFKPLFGAAQGIPNIPRPVVDLTFLNPAWRFELLGSTGIYYLVLLGIVLGILVSQRLASSRLGRSWMAMRADQDVAQANGINIVRIKLLAFAFSAGFAGMAGAISGTRLFGAYPDSFTLLVSINVLSLIIIGGLGSIPGIIIGAFVLVGLPEALRELSDYRLLVFGALLVVAMLLKPEGLIPPPVRRLSEIVLDRKGSEHAGRAAGD